MDQIKLEKQIMENMKSIFGFALTRLCNLAEAEELASDILYRILCSAPNLKDEGRFYGFLWKIAENTYADYLRNKVRNASRSAEFDENLVDASDSPLEEILKKEQLHLLRRELSLLSKQYRDATVLYYMENLSCSEIAEKLNISTEMVKYYLFRARKMLREGITMERLYGEKSYRPSTFEIDFWGTKAGDDREYRDFQARKIKGNILLAAYYTPVTAQELSLELGVALPYLEDEIQLLLDRQYLVHRNGKYLTNIPIFTLDCTQAIDEKLQTLTAATAEKLIAITDEFDSRFAGRFPNQNLARWQKVLLCLHFSLNETGNDFERNYGELPADGPYALVNGGGGRGIIWGRSRETVAEEKLPRGIQGVYNGCPCADGKGSVIAMNFRQTLNAQHFQVRMTDPIVAAATGGVVSPDWQARLSDLGYTKDEKANFTVWTADEYAQLQEMLSSSIASITEFNRQTSELAAGICADLAPAHIRKTAAYVGAFVYRFNAFESLVNILFDNGWLNAVNEKEKPAVCVVKN